MPRTAVPLQKRYGSRWRPRSPLTPVTSTRHRRCTSAQRRPTARGSTTCGASAGPRNGLATSMRHVRRSRPSWRSPVRRTACETRCCRRYGSCRKPRRRNPRSPQRPLPTCQRRGRQPMRLGRPSALRLVRLRSFRRQRQLGLQRAPKSRDVCGLQRPGCGRVPDWLLRLSERGPWLAWNMRNWTATEAHGTAIVPRTDRSASTRGPVRPW